MENRHRHLLTVWLALMSLTLAIAVAADVTHASRLGPIWLVAIAVVTVIKTRLVLADYLGLRANRSALLGMTAAIAFTMTIVTAVFVIVRT